MLRVSEAQYSLLMDRAGKKKLPAGAGKPRVKKEKWELPENILVGQVTDFMRSRGFTMTRQHVGTYVPYRVLMRIATCTRGDVWNEIESAKRNIVRVGREGDADWRFERHQVGPLHQLGYIEFKAPGRKPEPHQLEWLRRRRAMGTPAEYFDSFAVGKKPFLPWYRRTFEPDLPLSPEEKRAAAEEKGW